MNEKRSGFAYGITAYLVGGIAPIYFGLLDRVSAFEIVPWRVFATLAFCAILLTVTRRWRQLAAILRNRKAVGWLVLAAFAVYFNWQLYVVGVLSGRVLETALGYFMNPLFTIILGVIVWREKLSRLQWVAVSVAALGVLYAAVAYGTVPWIAIAIMVSFGLYGALKKKAGAGIDGISGLTVETLATSPVALIQLGIVMSISGSTAFTQGPGLGGLVLLGGIMTGVPLILFGEGTRRLPLTYMGFLQFMTPILGFLYGYFVLHEEMSTGRWVGFIAVWIAVVLLCIDMARGVVVSRRAGAAAVAFDERCADPEQARE